MNSWFTEFGWIVLGSVAGSLVAMLAARNMSVAGRVQTLLVGTLAGCFVGPAVCEIWFPDYDPKDSSVPALVCFVCGLVALAVVPTLIKRAKDIASKIQIKVVHSGASNDDS